MSIQQPLNIARCHFLGGHPLPVLTQVIMPVDASGIITAIRWLRLKRRPRPKTWALIYWAWAQPQVMAQGESHPSCLHKLNVELVRNVPQARSLRHTSECTTCAEYGGISGSLRTSSRPNRVMKKMPHKLRATHFPSLRCFGASALWTQAPAGSATNQDRFYSCLGRATSFEPSGSGPWP